MAEFVPLPFILAEKSHRTIGTREWTLIKMRTNMNDDVVSALIRVMTIKHIATVVIYQLSALREFASKGEEPFLAKILTGVALPVLFRPCSEV